MAISSPGIGSNLDVNAIVSKLMAIERQPLARLDQREVSFQARLSAFGTLKGSLGSFQTAAVALKDATRFQTRTATSSDAAVVSATAGRAAALGTFSVSVTALAQAQSLVAAGQASSTAAIGSGTDTTITFQFGTISGGTLTNGVYAGANFTQNGDQPSRSVTITAQNNSLVGIRDAINGADLGVTASIVGDGSNTPYRLVLQSSATGANRSMRISVAGDAALASLLSYDPAGVQNLTQTVAAQNAAFSVNGLALTAATNSVTTALEGVNLTLTKTGNATLTIGRDTAGAERLVGDFVKAYNELNGTLDRLASYNPETRQAGPLNGDSAVRGIQGRLRALLGETLGPGLSLATLSQVGISFQRDGTLAFDTTKFQAAATQNRSEDLAGVFAQSGRASDPLLEFLGSTDATRPGRYVVNVTSLATQGSVVGSGAANLTITAGVNDALSVTVDGVSASVTIAAGTYTAASLAAALQATINGNSALSTAGAAVTVSENAGVLTLRSNRYGSTSNVSVSGSGAADLLGSAPVATAGTDVAGTIDGVAATGAGRVLTAAASSRAQGLQVEVLGGATGERGTVTAMRGYAARMDGLIQNILSSSGVISARTDGINRSIEDLNGQRETFNRRLADIETRYRAQFTALDTMLGSMLATSNFLTQQLAALNRGTDRR
jgi:flagellar hook-associated protein 2